MGACPSPHGCIPRPGGTRLWHDAGDPSAAAAAPCERERSAAGPVRSPGWAPGAERRRREEKGEGKEGAPAVLQCSAAPSRARRPGSAPPLQQCRCEHRAAPGRTGPGIPCPTGPPPAPTAPSFGSPPLSRPRFVFLPLLPGRRDVSSRCPGDLPLAHCLPRRGGGGLILPPAPEARRPRRQSPSSSQLPGFWPRLPPTPGLLRSPRCCPDSGRVPGLRPAPLQLLLGETPPSPRYLRAAPWGPPPSPSSESELRPVPALASPRSRCKQRCVSHAGPQAGEGGPTSAPLPRSWHLTLGHAPRGHATPRPRVGAPGKGDPHAAAPCPAPCSARAAPPAGTPRCRCAVVCGHGCQ